ncbi:MAG TPA: hypothetical protein VEU95_16580, partial [Micropepsaceae bacterium]|nr:hypothetical protein [Micropepsaceae bacterium]
MANLDIVNWLMGHVILEAGGTYKLVDNATTTFMTGITYGEIQQSIYQLLGDGESLGDTFLGPYDMTKVANIVGHAVSQGEGYVPDVTDNDPSNDKIAVLLDTSTPGHIRQPLLIETTSAAIGDYVWHDLNANGI